ncbi:MAG: putative glycosyltransferase, exosortase G system-associated [Lachnospiraceae bacterium]|nr:putative glycosyltransferase, exosortase G system-associated [Lachnospiraceae bacterium]
MTLISSFFNSALFWAAWVVIPFIMEIIPSLMSAAVLIGKLIHPKKYKDPAFWPEVTLIIPVYNSEETLENCIKSINDSTYPNERIKIYFVDNQGKDDSFGVYTKCQNEYPELMMQWLNSKQGKSRALNLALFNSDGKYIIHVDSDGQFEKHAITNLVKKFESDVSIDCMTGAILTEPAMIEGYKGFFAKILRRAEFMEYAQAFLAGRNAAEFTNSIYTLSGAFSAFRKSAVLKSHLYDTDTICEDTNITFQMRYIQKVKIHICENAIFFVDPIENMNKLYTQRQRWQRGSLEVSHQFAGKKLHVFQMFTDVAIRTLMYDHTFAFPRIIWYLALICLTAIGYSPSLIIVSTLIIYIMYIISGFLYFFSNRGYLREFKDLRKYYTKHFAIVFVLPLFNMLVFFIRFAGIINSINTDSAWRTNTLSDEREMFAEEVRKELQRPVNILEKMRGWFNTAPEEQPEKNG